MKPMSRTDKLRKIFPLAKNIGDVGNCDNCGRSGYLFFTLTDTLQVDGENYVEGGFCCLHCGFSNAGRMAQEWIGWIEE